LRGLINKSDTVQKNKINRRKLAHV